MANQTVTDFGKTKEGRQAYLYTLENKNGLKAYVSDFGASLVRLLVPDREGKMIDVVHGYSDAAGYERGDGGIGALRKMTTAIICTVDMTTIRNESGM